MRPIIAMSILLMQLFTLGQSRWTEPILEEYDAIGMGLIESYDKGYLALGWYGGSHPNYNWLIKSDINGVVIWGKTFGDNLNTIGLIGIDININGDIFLSGGTNYYDTYHDPLVIKINSCGDMEWCRVFNTPGNYDYSQYVVSIENGGCVVLLNNTGPDSNYYGVRVALAELDANGGLIWQQSYNSPDSSFQAEIIVHVLRTLDGGYLMSGLCDYEDPTHPGLFWTHPYYIKVDSVGNFEWEKVVAKETPSNGGAAWSTVINPDSTFYYSSISHYYYAPSSSSPALLKMDFEGNVIEIYDVVSGYRDGALSSAAFINDSILAASAGWGNTDDSLWSYALIIDTLGNLLNSRILVQDLYTSYLQVIYDGKLLYMSNTSQNSEFDVILTKLNKNLEQDTFYTMPFTYDSLCPYQIVSDTIVQDDCGLIVGIEEDGRTVGLYDDKKGGLKIWPNPAAKNVNCQLSNVDGQKKSSTFNIQYSISVYDIFGRSAPTPALPHSVEGGWILDVSNLPPGIYFIVIRDERNVIGTGKFVVAR